MNIFDIFSIGKIKQENENLKHELEQLKKKLDDLGYEEYEQVKAKINEMQKENDALIATKQKDLEILTTTKQKELNDLDHNITDNNSTIAKLQEEIISLKQQEEKFKKQVNSQQRKLSRLKELFNSVDYTIKNFMTTDITTDFDEPDTSDLDLETPSVILKLHCMDIKDLRKAYRDNDKQINIVLDSYSSRYTTKANKAIYQLMVIALRAELQNILYNLKYEKLDQSIDNVKQVTAKYLKIAGDGNQSIAGTLTKFIGQIEYLFINAVKIEYNYYVKKEKARQEQLAIKEQMRQEAAERKALEQERKKIEKEEEKYKLEINRIEEQIKNATDSEIEKLKAQILSLQSSLSDVTIKKDEITSLQNGKAGNVYIISNLGSFGENIFKIGMTRRLNPQERIDELGSASVPFKFDVHSFIFSDNAVELENKLHTELNHKRVNKVNLRKEFFYATLDELEEPVTKLDPTAEFNKTMIAEEYRQSQSTDEVYSSDFTMQDDE